MPALPALRDSSLAAALRQVLLDHVCQVTPGVLPGGDGLTLDDVLREYPRLAERGLVPSPRQLRLWHPELTGELQAFFGAAMHRDTWAALRYHQDHRRRQPLAETAPAMN